MHKVLTRLFGTPMEVNGHGYHDTYMYRWILFRCARFRIYVHHFVGDDWSRDLHDHPKRFISIGLRGWYIEETPSGKQIYRAPWIRSFPATHRHRLLVPSGNCWTLVIVLRNIREWGFWKNGQKFVPWQEYVSNPDNHQQE